MSPLAVAVLVVVHVVGRGTPLATTIDAGPCPQGRTVYALRAGGSEHLCVLTIRKTSTSIVQTVQAVDRLARGTIVSRQTQVFRFSRDWSRSTAIFSGRVTGGTGRYAGATGTISGGGPTDAGRAAWTLRFRLRRQ